MNITKSTAGRLLAATSILALALLVACAPGFTAGAALAPISSGSGALANFCHATGNAENPYELVTITSGDFGPAPVGGCPTTLVAVTSGRIQICHATNIAAEPYKEVSVSINGLDGHATHEGDFFPVPEGGCPTATVSTAQADGKITICHATGSSKNPYNMITVSVNGLNGHDKHAGDIIPAPAAGCPKP